MKVPVLGVGIDSISLEELLDRVEGAISLGEAITVAYANVHVLNRARADDGLKAFLNSAEVCFCDGNGVRLGALIGGDRLPHRMTGADWIWDLAARAEGRWRIYWIGGAEGVTAEAARRLLERHPRLQVATDHGYHPRAGPEDTGSIERINAFEPDIVLVGMGTPEQERWVADRRGRIEAPVVWCLGATADFLAGRVPRGPRWLTDRAEWLGRLAAEPHRLWRRYLVGNPAFLAAVIRQRWSRHS